MEVKKQCLSQVRTVFDSEVKAVGEGSIIVPDVKPDIIKVLEVTADTFLCDKTVEEGKVTLTGKVNVTVIYTPECDDMSVCAIYGCFDFCEVVKNPDFTRGMTVIATCDAQKVTYRLINSRKIGIEANVILNVQVLGGEEFEYVSEIEGDDVECRFENVNICMPGMYKEYNFTMEESFCPTVGKAEIRDILRGNVDISDKEHKAITDKVVVKGKGMVNVLYLDCEGEIEHLQCEMPFTEVVEMSGICEDTECDVSFETGEVRIEAASGSEINASFDVTCRIKTHQEENITAVSDCYFTDSTEVLDYIDICADETVARVEFSAITKEILTKKENMPEICGVYSAVAKPYPESVKIHGSKILVSGKSVIYILYTTDSEQMPVCSMNEEIPFNYAIDCENLSEECDILLKCQCEHISSVICSGDAVEVRCGISICGKATKKRNVRMVSYAKKGERLTKESGILVYFAKTGDCVWDVAKKYRVTQKCICDSIGGSDEICKGMKVIIPIK